MYNKQRRIRNQVYLFLIGKTNKLMLATAYNANIFIFQSYNVNLHQKFKKLQLNFLSNYYGFWKKKTGIIKYTVY